MSTHPLSAVLSDEAVALLDAARGASAMSPVTREGEFVLKLLQLIDVLAALCVSTDAKRCARRIAPLAARLEKAASRRSVARAELKTALDEWNSALRQLQAIAQQLISRGFKRAHRAP